MTYHFLKTEAEFYKYVETGEKTFELRKNDRDYKVGDIVILKEVINGKHTGRQMPPRLINYIFTVASTVYKRAIVFFNFVKQQLNIMDEQILDFEFDEWFDLMSDHLKTLGYTGMLDKNSFEFYWETGETPEYAAERYFLEYNDLA